MTGRIPDWVLERARVGELTEGFSVADLAADPSVPERLAKLRAEDEQLLERHPPRVVAAQVRERARRQREPIGRAAFRWVPVAVAAGVIAIVTPLAMRDQGRGDVLTKGLKAHLEVFRQGSNEPLKEGAVARPGDVVQLRIVGAGARYGAVYATDGTRTEVLTPDVLPLPPSGSVTLPDALELDAAGAFERFILVTSRRAFPPTEVLGAAGKEPLVLPEGFTASTFQLVKQR
jgi:hypothetical protein